MLPLLLLQKNGGLAFWSNSLLLCSHVLNAKERMVFQFPYECEGKDGVSVPLKLSLEMRSAIELLLHRKTVGTPEKNPYTFGGFDEHTFL